MINTDLHSHSYYSDGVLSPKEVVIRAKEKGIKNLALTDHNSIEGVEEAMKEGKKIGINVIPSIELKFSGGELLGYFVDIKNKRFLDSIKEIREIYYKRTGEICKEIKNNGIDISLEGLENKFQKAKENLTWTHILYYLYEKRFKDSLSEISKFLFEKIRWKKIKEISIEEAIKIILDCGGIPVLAHPWITKKSKSLLEESKLNNLVNIGLRGIEIDQGDRNERRDEDFVNKIKKSAEKYDLILTSGSDFHGDFLIDPKEDRNHHELGAHNCDEIILTELLKSKERGQMKLFR